MFPRNHDSLNTYASLLSFAGNGQRKERNLLFTQCLCMRCGSSTAKMVQGLSLCAGTNQFWQEAHARPLCEPRIVFRPSSWCLFRLGNFSDRIYGTDNYLKQQCCFLVVIGGVKYNVSMCQMALVGSTYDLTPPITHS